MSRDVWLLLLSFGERDQRASLDLAEAMIARVFGVEPRVVVIDNQLGGRVEIQLDGRADRISGDNASREFSGWDRGLSWMDAALRASRGGDADPIVVLANDTIVRDDKAPRVRALAAERAQLAARGALVGWVDAYPRPVRAFGRATRQWVDTSLVIARRRVIDRLRPLAIDFSDQDVFADDAARLFRDPSPLSENYRAYLRTWLFGERGDPEFAHAWHAQSALSARNFDAFKAKIRCILCEHQLSARARDLGIPLADIRPDPLAIDPS
jgi:hypothetical protein